MPGGGLRADSVQRSLRTSGRNYVLVFDVVFNYVPFDESLEQSDLVITAEDRSTARQGMEKYRPRSRVARMKLAWWRSVWRACWARATSIPLVLPAMGSTLCSALLVVRWTSTPV